MNADPVESQYCEWLKILNMKYYSRVLLPKTLRIPRVNANIKIKMVSNMMKYQHKKKIKVCLATSVIQKSMKHLVKVGYRGGSPTHLVQNGSPLFSIHMNHLIRRLMFNPFHPIRLYGLRAALAHNDGHVFFGVFCFIFF